MEKKIVFTSVEPNKNLLWLHYKNGLLVLQRFGSNGWEDISNSYHTIRTDISQDFSNAQQDVALSNIGLPLVHVDYSLIGSTLDDSTYNKLLTAKGVFLENVPDENNAPSLYFVGSSNTVATIFVSEFNARIWFVLTLSYSSKKLSLVSTGYASDVVRYGEGQNLTDTQKQQARTNMGVQSADELLENADFIAQLKTKLETV